MLQYYLAYPMYEPEQRRLALAFLKSQRIDAKDIVENPYDANLQLFSHNIPENAVPILVMPSLITPVLLGTMRFCMLGLYKGEPIYVGQPRLINRQYSAPQQVERTTVRLFRADKVYFDPQLQLLTVEKGLLYREVHNPKFKVPGQIVQGFDANRVAPVHERIEVDVLYPPKTTPRELQLQAVAPLWHMQLKPHKLAPDQKDLPPGNNPVILIVNRPNKTMLRLHDERNPRVIGVIMGQRLMPSQGHYVMDGVPLLEKPAGAPRDSFGWQRGTVVKLEFMTLALLAGETDLWNIQAQDEFTEKITTEPVV